MTDTKGQGKPLASPGDEAHELGPESVGLKGVLSHRPKPYGLAEATHLIGDDFGYANTSAQAVHPVDKPLSSSFFEETATWSKAQAREYLSTHAHPGEPIETVLHDGRDFLGGINKHALAVDGLRREIDRLYLRFHCIKFEVCRITGLPSDAKLDFDMNANGDKRLTKLLGKLRLLTKQIAGLKVLRRGHYRSVDGIKKSWFGWLANRGVELALRYRAAVVVEDLTLVAKEKGAPEYMGRTFNKMTNNGSVGQYRRASSQKLKWYGIPEVRVPSYYTSSTDIRHGVVDKKQRKSQDRFVAHRDGKVWQADLHAATTIALYPLLRPIQAGNQHLVV